MTNKQLANTLVKIHALKSRIDAEKKELEALQELVKAEMKAQDISEVTAGGFTAKVSIFTTSRLDTAAFKKDHNDLYQQYCKSSSQTRFTIK